MCNWCGCKISPKDPALLWSQQAWGRKQEKWRTPLCQTSLSWQQWNNPRSFLTFVLGTGEKRLQLAALHWRTMTLQVWVVHCREFLLLPCPQLAVLFLKKKGQEGGTISGRSQVILWRGPFDPYLGWSQQGDKYPYQPPESELHKLAISWLKSYTSFHSGKNDQSLLWTSISLFPDKNKVKIKL